jgi:hypothetical protein
VISVGFLLIPKMFHQLVLFSNGFVWFIIVPYDFTCVLRFPAVFDPFRFRSGIVDINCTVALASECSEF